MVALRALVRDHHIAVCSERVARSVVGSLPRMVLGERLAGCFANAYRAFLEHESS